MFALVEHVILVSNFVDTFRTIDLSTPCFLSERLRNCFGEFLFVYCSMDGKPGASSSASFYCTRCRFVVVGSSSTALREFLLSLLSSMIGCMSFPVSQFTSYPEFCVWGKCCYELLYAVSVRKSLQDSLSSSVSIFLDLFLLASRRYFRSKTDSWASSIMSFFENSSSGENKTDMGWVTSDPFSS